MTDQFGNIIKIVTRPMVLWSIVSCHSAVAEYWWLNPVVSWVRLTVTAGLFTSLYFHLITSKFLYIMYNILSSMVHVYGMLFVLISCPQENVIMTVH